MEPGNFATQVPQGLAPPLPYPWPQKLRATVFRASELFQNIVPGISPNYTFPIDAFILTDWTSDTPQQSSLLNTHFQLRFYIFC